MRLGDVISFGGGLYIIAGFYNSPDGIVRAFELKPFIGDPTNIDDINAALGSVNHASIS